MNLDGGAEAGFDRALDPRVGEGGVLAGKVDAALGRDDVAVQLRLLAGVEEREGAPGELVVVPHLRRPHFELLLRSVFGMLYKLSR